MPGGTSVALGNCLMEQLLYLPSVTYPALASGASEDNTVSVPGVLPGDLIQCQQIGPTTGVILANAYVSAAGTVTLRWVADDLALLSMTLSPSAVSANTTAEQTFNQSGIGLLAGDIVFVNKPTAQAGLGIVGARVSATDTLAITFSNNTGSSITPTASQVYLIGRARQIVTGTVPLLMRVLRPQTSSIGITALPNQVV